MHSSNPYQDISGTEFVNDNVRDALVRLGIKHFESRSQHKASIIERVFRTVRNLIMQWSNFTNSKKWTTIFKDVETSYNNTYHSSIGNRMSLTMNHLDLIRRLHLILGMKPVEVTKQNEQVGHRNLYGGKRYKTKDCLYPPGTLVRLVLPRKTFAKEGTFHFTSEIFQVVKCFKRSFPVYQLRTTDEARDLVTGLFYKEQLSVVPQ